MLLRCLCANVGVPCFRGKGPLSPVQVWLADHITEASFKAGSEIICGSDSCHLCIFLHLFPFLASPLTATSKLHQDVDSEKAASEQPQTLQLSQHMNQFFKGPVSWLLRS